MKQRFSSLDVTVIAHELSKSLTSLRVQNIYDLSSRIFLIKFHKPGQREQLIIQSGFRCHLTQYARTTANEPSPLSKSLRQTLRSKRVTSVAQVGTDRIIEFQFSGGQYRLFLEFYAAGNIILTDADLKIIALLREVEEGEEHERLRNGLQYDLSMRQNYGGIPPLTKERVRDGLQKAIQKQEKQAVNAKASKRKEKDVLRKALSVSIAEFPPLLMDHAFKVTGFDSNTKPEQVLEDESTLDKLMLAFDEARRVIPEITSADTAKGYILAKRSAPKDNASEANDGDNNLLYDDFHPFRPQQFENNPDIEFLEFEGFNKTVDEFFSSIEGQQLDTRLHEREATAKRRLDQAREDHAKRLGDLQEAQQLHIRKADAIKANVERVQEAMSAMNGLIVKGMDWVEIARLIEREQEQGNAVARMIKLPLKLYENTITLLLAEQTYEDEDDDEGYDSSSSESSSNGEETSPKPTEKEPAKFEDKRLAIDINLGLSPWQNANEYFDQKKNAAVKEEKTAQALDKALKSTEKKIAADLKKGLKQEKDVLRPVRGKLWFEKFTYFISSDGYLVIGGKDIQQHEMIYQRHLKKGDVYVHADLHGASPFVIKNQVSTPEAPIPPSTLSQAGHLCVCTSAAWDSKAVMSAWWVNFDQVTKLGRTGEYLPVGSFNISGKKNFLPPAQLLLGFGIVFQITEESQANHAKHRITEGEAQQLSDDETLVEAEDGHASDDQDSESDSDEEFPDAKLDSGSEDDHENEDDAQTNPLEPFHQPSTNATYRNESDTDEDKYVPELDDGKFSMSGALNSTTETDSTKNKPRYLSARERRQIRKGQSRDQDLLSTTGTHAESDDEGTTEEQEDASSGVPTANKSTNTTQPSKPLPRGKRSKAKRRAAKYADQDEDDRALALRLLGVQPAEKNATAKAIDEKTKEEEAQAQKQRRREQHLRAQAAGRAAEEARRAAHADGETKAGTQGENVEQPQSNEPTAEELAAMQTPLDAFVGRPHPSDSIILAIPVCAPYSALANYKYKVKLQPGMVKKGKAVKEILSKWDAAAKEPRAVDREGKDTDRMWPAEIEAMRAWKEAEVYGVVPVGKVKVVQSGPGWQQGSGGGAKGGGKGKGGKKSARGGRGKKR